MFGIKRLIGRWTAPSEGGYENFAGTQVEFNKDGTGRYWHWSAGEVIGPEDGTEFRWSEFSKNALLITLGEDEYKFEYIIYKKKDSFGAKGRYIKPMDPELTSPTSKIPFFIFSGELLKL